MDPLDTDTPIRINPVLIAFIVGLIVGFAVNGAPLAFAAGVRVATMFCHAG